MYDNKHSYQEEEQLSSLPRPKKCTQCRMPVYTGCTCEHCETPDIRDLAAEEELPF